MLGTSLKGEGSAQKKGSVTISPFSAKRFQRMLGTSQKGEGSAQKKGSVTIFLKKKGP